MTSTPHAQQTFSSRASALLTIGAILFVLTTASFLLSRLHLGRVGLVIAIAIAVTKSILIALFFMHLLERRGSNGLVFGTAVLFVVILVTFILLEMGTRFAPTAVPGPFVNATPASAP